MRSDAVTSVIRPAADGDNLALFLRVWEADVFSRQTLPCCVCRVFLAVRWRLSLRGTAHPHGGTCPKAISI